MSPTALAKRMAIRRAAVGDVSQRYGPRRPGRVLPVAGVLVTVGCVPPRWKVPLISPAGPVRAGEVSVLVAYECRYACLGRGFDREQVAGLASERVAEPGKGGEADCPGPAVLEYRQIHHGYLSPVGQFGERHAPLREQLVKVTDHAVLSGRGRRRHRSDEPFCVSGQFGASPKRLRERQQEKR